MSIIVAIFNVNLFGCNNGIVREAPTWGPLKLEASD